MPDPNLVHFSDAKRKTMIKSSHLIGNSSDIIQYTKFERGDIIGTSFQCQQTSDDVTQWLSKSENTIQFNGYKERIFKQRNDIV